MAFRPLVVDLDGTLCHSDLLHEALLRLLLTKPLHIWAIPFWLLKGKAVFKHRLAQLIEPVIEGLPASKACLQMINEAHGQTRTIILATASHQSYAAKVQAQYPQIDQCLASNEHINLGGARKAQALTELYGKAGFDYAGNARVDFEVWDYAAKRIAVNPSLTVEREFLSRYPEGTVLKDKSDSTVRNYVKMLRPHQWAKNFLVFIPLLTAHSFTDIPALTSAVCAFVGFCLTASAIYIINDLSDLPNDRLHPVKRLRPLAAGAISPLHALALVPVLLGLAGCLCLFLPLDFSVLLAGYLGLTTAYTFWLKRKLLLDVFTLAGLYTLRIFAGAAAINVAVSPWLLLLSVFLFFSLALVKRYAELRRNANDGHSTIAGRGYNTADMPLLALLGVSSGLASVLILALYLNSEQVGQLYSQPQFLWASCLLLMYWVSRIWILANRGLVEEDPINFAMRDINSLVTGFLFLAIFASAI